MEQQPIALATAVRTALNQLCPPTHREQLNILACQERRDINISQGISTDEARAVRRIRGKGKH